jgi:hypothetical protein
MRFGRNRPTRPSPHKAMARYVSASTIQAPPASQDLSAAAIAGLMNIDGNDQLGDCTAAEYAHSINLWTANAGTLFLPTLDEVVAFYSACSGYVPGNPATDQGADELTVIDVAVKTGLAGHQIVGAVAVDPTNETEVATAIWLFGCLSLCVELPDAWVNPIPSGPGFTWDVAGAPNPAQGHCVQLYGYDSLGVFVDTWGLVSADTPTRITWAALAQYGATSAGGSLYGMLSPDWDVKASNGFDADQLVADMAAYGSTLT